MTGSTRTAKVQDRSPIATFVKRSFDQNCTRASFTLKNTSKQCVKMRTGHQNRSHVVVDASIISLGLAEERKSLVAVVLLSRLVAVSQSSRLLPKESHRSLNSIWTVLWKPNENKYLDLSAKMQ